MVQWCTRIQTEIHDNSNVAYSVANLPTTVLYNTRAFGIGAGCRRMSRPPRKTYTPDPWVADIPFHRNSTNIVRYYIILYCYYCTTLNACAPCKWSRYYTSCVQYTKTYYTLRLELYLIYTKYLLLAGGLFALHNLSFIGLHIQIYFLQGVIIITMGNGYNILLVAWQITISEYNL